MNRSTKVLALLSASAGLVALAGCGSSGGSAASSSGSGGSGAKGSITFGMQGPPAAFDDLPTYLAIKQLKSEGYQTKVVDFSDPDVLTNALVSGKVDVGDVAAGTIFSAVDAGAPVKAFISASDTNYEMIARTGLNSCSDLSGKKVAVESSTGTTGSLTALWFKHDCPSANPQITILPGSNNRVSGLLAGQIDAAAIDLQDAMPLLQKYPTKFHVISSFSQARQEAAMLFARTDWMTKNSAILKAFTSAYVSVLQKGYAHPGMLVAEAKAVIPDTPTATLQAVVSQWVTQKLWNPVTGVQPASVAGAIKLYGNASPYKSVKTPSQVSTTEFVAGLPSI